MQDKDVRHDMRVIARTGATARSEVHGTVLSKGVGGYVRVAYDNGDIGMHRADSLHPLDWLADKRDPEALPRLWKRAGGWLYWRGGEPYRACREEGGTTWRVRPYTADVELERPIVRGARTRAAAIAEAVARVDARRTMLFHEGTLPSLHLDGADASHLEGEGWEVCQVAEGMFEVTHGGDLVASIEQDDEGLFYVELLEGGGNELGRDLPSIEMAAMRVLREYPFL
ncbi:hypothetical protein AB0L54_32675 [Streptomyces sp. NPDC052196]|uniref:hypothetical protein n=1 Tax=Streptomyces sp. NPDC052196 TaxID=3156691 RepID=UPI00342C28EF